MSVFVIIPVKSLRESKMRLSRCLSPADRRKLSYAMVSDVMYAAKKARKIDKILIVSSDITILGLAEDLGLCRIPDQDEGLNKALLQAMEWCTQFGASVSLIIPGDLPLLKPKDLDEIIDLAPKGKGVVICSSPDGGTNALLCKPANLLIPQFGPKSYERHVAEADKLGVPCLSYCPRPAFLDIDTPEDLDRLKSEECGIFTRKFLEHFMSCTERNSTPTELPRV